MIEQISVAICGDFNLSCSIIKVPNYNINRLPLSKVKFLAKEFFQAQETIIVGDKVAIAVFTERPYAFLIEDKVVADGYRKYFEVL